MFKRAVCCLVLLALALLSNGSAGAQNNVVDVAAITLRPADVGSSAWVHDGAFVEHLDGEAANAAAYLGRGLTAGSIETKLTSFGWIRMYVDNLSRPATTNGGPPVQRIRSYVTKYATAEGAAAGFTFLEDESSVASAKDIPGTRTFGDQSEITVDRGTSASDGRPYRSMDLTFRVGTLVAGVTLIVYPSNLGIDPDQKQVEALAATMEARIKNPSQEGATLGVVALRLNPPGHEIITYDDAYYRFNAIDVPLQGESKTAAGLRTHTYAGAIDVYQLWQGIDVGPTSGMLFGVTVLHFPSESSAADWLAKLPAILGENPFYADVRPVRGGTGVGDQSSALSYTSGGGSNKPRSMIVAARVGAIVARIHLVPQGKTGDASLAPTLALAQTEAACLAAGVCPELTTLPGTLSVATASSPTAIDRASPVATPAS